MTLEQFRSVPLFESLDDAAARDLCDLLKTLDCRQSTVLFHAGDAGDAMYLIESGSVRISVPTADEQELTLAEMRAGDFFGEIALLDGQPRSANAIAMEDSRLAVLSRADFLAFFNAKPQVAVEMLGAVARRLRRTDELLRRRTSLNVNDVAAARLTMADHAADLLAEFGGSWKFIGVAIVFFIAWMALNSWMLTSKSFDPFPYVLLNLVLGIITGLQGPIIMMSQNRQSQKDRLRADLDYQVNLKNEIALGEILQRVQILEREVMKHGRSERGG